MKLTTDIGFPSDLTSYDGVDTASRAFAGATYGAPGATSGAALEIGPVEIASSKAFNQPKDYPTEIRIMVQTGAVWSDLSELRVFYHLTTSDGGTDFRTDGVSVRMTVTDDLYVVSLYIAYIYILII